MKTVLTAIICGLTVLVWTPMVARCPAAEKIGYEILYLNERAVHPREITRRTGPFVLIVKNHSNLKRLAIRVKLRGGPAELARANMDDKNGSSDMILDLAPGIYDLFEPGNPKLTCTITITP